MADGEILRIAPPADGALGLSNPTAAQESELGKLFYRQILPASLMPEVVCPPDVVPIIGQVIDDKTLVLGGAAHVLRGHQLNAFNSVVYQRGAGNLSASQIMRFGFHADAIEKTRATNFGQTMRYLIDKLVVGDQGIIVPTGSGKWRRYHMLPQFQIEDLREAHRPEEPRQILYQTISSRLVNPGERAIVGPPADREVQIAIMANNSIGHDAPGANRQETLNEHELTLLNLFILTGKQALTYEELKALGFHLYATNDNGWSSALYRTVHSLGKKLSLDAQAEALAMETFVKSSFVRWTYPMGIPISCSRIDISKFPV